MSKEKQTFDLAFTGIPDNAYNEQPTESMNAAYFAKLRQDREKAAQRVAPVSQEKKQETADREQKIHELYPDSYEENIPLRNLVPAPEEWNFFPQWNNEQIAELMENISVYGQLSPALVWEQEDGTYMILGGHNRYFAIKKLHDILAPQYPEEAKAYETMRCNVYAHDTLDEVEARKIIIFDNTIRRENSKNIMRRSIINMNQLMKETRESRRPDKKRETISAQIAQTMDVSERTVAGIVSLRNLIPEFWPLFDEKERSRRITNAFALAISHLPENLQRYIYNNELYINARLSAAQLKQLRYAQDEEMIQDIFTAPVRYHVTASTELDQKPPQDRHPFVLFAAAEEVNALKQAILNSDVSQQTKDLAMKTL